MNGTDDNTIVMNLVRKGEAVCEGQCLNDLTKLLL